jgi:type III secretion protein J
MPAFVRVCCVIALLAILPGCRDQVLYSGLAQREANEMMALLNRAGVNAKLALEARGGTLALNVPQAQAVAAVDALTRAGLPRHKTPTMSEMLPKDTWMLSPSEERAKLAYALSQEMTGTLRQVNGISDVRVHFAPADRNALGQVTAAPSASVFVRYDADLIGPDFADSIKSLVANSVAGLSYDKVAVLMLPQHDVPGGAVRASLPSLIPPAAASVPTATAPILTSPAAAISGLFNGNIAKWLGAAALAAILAALFFRLVRPRA